MTILFLPFPALASQLADCDGKTYEVTVTNGGQSRIVTLSPHDGPITEFGPNVTFQIKGGRAVTIHEQGEQYCIWNGHIDIQKSNAGNSDTGGDPH